MVALRKTGSPSKTPAMRLGARQAAGGRVCASEPKLSNRKHPNGPKDWRRQWVFAQENRWKNAKTVEHGRHHVDHQGCGAQWMNNEKGVLMPIRITRRAK